MGFTCSRVLRNGLWSGRHFAFLSAVGSAMMESQGPSLSKGLPEQQTGAGDLIENSNGRGVIFLLVLSLLQAIFSVVHGVLNVYFECVINSSSCCQSTRSVEL